MANAVVERVGVDAEQAYRQAVIDMAEGKRVSMERIQAATLWSDRAPEQFKTDVDRMEKRLAAHRRLEAIGDIAATLAEARDREDAVKAGAAADVERLRLEYEAAVKGARLRIAEAHQAVAAGESLLSERNQLVQSLYRSADKAIDDEERAASGPALECNRARYPVSPAEIVEKEEEIKTIEAEVAAIKAKPEPATEPERRERLAILARLDHKLRIAGAQLSDMQTRRLYANQANQTRNAALARVEEVGRKRLDPYRMQWSCPKPK